MAVAAGGTVSGTTEAFARANIDAQFNDAGWEITDDASVPFEYAVPDGTLADYVLCDRAGRPMAALEAMARATRGPHESERFERTPEPGQLVGIDRNRATCFLGFLSIPGHPRSHLGYRNAVLSLVLGVSRPDRAPASRRTPR